MPAGRSLALQRRRSGSLDPVSSMYCSASMSTSDALTVMLDAQVAVAQAVGSRFYERLLELIREDAAADGPRHGRHWRATSTTASTSGTASGCCCGVHRMVLGGEADNLRAHFPSTGGDGDADAAWPAIHRLIAAGTPELVEALAHPLQTNAPSRAKALVGAFCFRSAASRAAAEAAGARRERRVEPATRQVPLRARRHHFRTRGLARPLRRLPDPAACRRSATGSRSWTVRGGDLHPIDATTEEGRLTLLACVFPDETERFGLLDQAIEVARATPAVVDRDDLASWVAATLAGRVRV